MSERTRHAAELASRLTTQCHYRMAERVRLKISITEIPNSAGKVARDVDKLLRLSASLRGIGERKCNGTMPKCEECGGSGGVDQETADGSHMETCCLICNGSGDDTRREKRLIQAVTDTLKPYGLTWQFESSRDGRRVGILFSDGPHDLLSGALHGWMV